MPRSQLELVALVALTVTVLFLALIALLAFLSRTPESLPTPTPPISAEIPVIDMTLTPLPSTLTLEPVPDLAFYVQEYQAVEQAVLAAPWNTELTDKKLVMVATNWALANLRSSIDYLRQQSAYQELTIEVLTQGPVGVSDASADVGYVEQRQRRTVHYFDRESEQPLDGSKSEELTIIYRLVREDGIWRVDAVAEQNQ